MRREWIQMHDNAFIPSLLYDPMALVLVNIDRTVGA